MDPCKAIDDKIDGLMGNVNRINNHMANEAADIVNQWDGLRRCGGQRADHAATLLSRLRPHLAEMARFCLACEKQIDEMVADPFESKAVHA